ncbi:unnamed protein product [Polarella glacialis]|uniref:Cyclin-dependent kinase 2 homolog n=1 Tax=Polarella glacialis TaxID=89957 RepID=A0A813D4Y5_POLGL|nr:unnamed protein product [Polarella glacialis]
MEAGTLSPRLDNLEAASLLVALVASRREAGLSDQEENAQGQGSQLPIPPNGLQSSPTSTSSSHCLAQLAGMQLMYEIGIPENIQGPILNVSQISGRAACEILHWLRQSPAKPRMVLVTVFNMLSGDKLFGPQQLPSSTKVVDLKRLVKQGSPLVSMNVQLVNGDQKLNNYDTLEDIQTEVVLGAVQTVCPLDLDEVSHRFDIRNSIGFGVNIAARRDSFPETELVVIKRSRYDHHDDRIGEQLLREIPLLQKLRHPNIITLHEVISEVSARSIDVCMVYELVDSDLYQYMRGHGHFADALALRSAARQLVQAVQFCHSQHVIHRDLKPQSVLVHIPSMTLKLGNFTLARVLYPRVAYMYTHEVVTLWYRPPEVLLGREDYGTSLDIWSLGCVLGQMATGFVLFPGESEIGTLFKIFQVLGTPSEELWPGVLELPDFSKKFPNFPRTELSAIRENATGLGSEGAELLSSCLRYVPEARPTEDELLLHPFFRE